MSSERPANSEIDWGSVVPCSVDTCGPYFDFAHSTPASVRQLLVRFSEDQLRTMATADAQHLVSKLSECGFINFSSEGARLSLFGSAVVDLEKGATYIPKSNISNLISSLRLFGTPEISLQNAYATLQSEMVEHGLAVRELDGKLKLTTLGSLCGNPQKYGTSGIYHAFYTELTELFC